MTEKEKFIKELKERTKLLAVNIIKFCRTLENDKASSIITYQLVKSATSVGANYRAACKARSKAEFFSKICIVVEEADETEYWLEVIMESKLTTHISELKRLLSETKEISKIVTKAKNTSYKSGS